MKAGTYVQKQCLALQLYKCDGFDLRNEPRNTKYDRLIKWSIMSISNETEPQ